MVASTMLGFVLGEFRLVWLFGKGVVRQNLKLCLLKTSRIRSIKYLARVAIQAVPLRFADDRFPTTSLWLDSQHLRVA